MKLLPSNNIRPIILYIVGHIRYCIIAKKKFHSLKRFVKTTVATVLRHTNSKKQKGDIRPMSHLQFYHAIFSRNFIARQNRKCDMACRATSEKSRNSFSG